MAALFIARQWNSDDSVDNSLILRDKTFSSASRESPENDKLISEPSCNQENNLKQASKRKAVNVVPKIANLSPKNRSDEYLEPSHVKVSALLYEITKRTNQLAQPRVRVTVAKTLQPRSTASQIPKASPRIIELSRPRAIYQQPSKPVGYVARSALQAIATQRIIELSRPRQKRRLKVSKRRKANYASCNSKTSSKLRKGKSRCFARHEKKKLDQEYDSLVQRKNDQKIKKKRIAKWKEHQLRSSNSNRTIIMVDLNLRDNPRLKPKSVRDVRYF